MIRVIKPFIALLVATTFLTIDGLFRGGVYYLSRGHGAGSGQHLRGADAIYSHS